MLGAMYASGPVGRMGADEAIRLITRRENMRKEEEEKEKANEPRPKIAKKGESNERAEGG